jgi:hypothetical protein
MQPGLRQSWTEGKHMTLNGDRASMYVLPDEDPGLHAMGAEAGRRVWGHSAADTVGQPPASSIRLRLRAQFSRADLRPPLNDVAVRKHDGFRSFLRRHRLGVVEGAAVCAAAAPHCCLRPIDLPIHVLCGCKRNTSARAGKPLYPPVHRLRLTTHVSVHLSTNFQLASPRKIETRPLETWH